MASVTTDTIAAIATPPGNGGVGIIRISGSKSLTIAEQITGKIPSPRYALYSSFKTQTQIVLDSGIVLYYPAPHSFTGEDVIELQGHGGQIVCQMILKRVLECGARIARPGEFSERAFLNNKIDLIQAEAIADLIQSSTEQSVKSAQQSLQGVFSKKIDNLLDELTELRVYVEAAIDFVDEDIDFLSDGIVEHRIVTISQQIQSILNTAQQGRLLRDGMTIVLAGKPNAGKSSLLNALTGYDAAIVTEIAGTTRDVLKERIQIDGMPLHIIDTAGLRDSENLVEQEGIRRAHQEIQQADEILLIIDINDPDIQAIEQTLPENSNITRIYNKIDLLQHAPQIKHTTQGTEIYLSVKKNLGMELLTEHLKSTVGYSGRDENIFIARTRHIEALKTANEFITHAQAQLKIGAGELVAEDLRQAQNSLGEITGAFSSDDLLGKIFGTFCIGK
jgi:tRNA modification GTPase